MKAALGIVECDDFNMALPWNEALNFGQAQLNNRHFHC